MADAVTSWIEHGLLQVVHHLSGEGWVDQTAESLAVVLPPVTGLVRLWGHFDTARAAGFAAALQQPQLRAATRAAAVEFCAWPSATVAGVLRRAEADAVAEPWRSRLPEDLLTDVADRVAVAWALHQPEALAQVYERLYTRRGRRPIASGLWQQAISTEAARRTLLPPAAHLPAGDTAEWVKQAHWGLTAAQRARASLALAAAAWAEEEPAGR